MIKNKKSLIIGLVTGFAFGLFLRLMSHDRSGLMSVMSVSFLLIGPLVIGFLTVKMTKRSDIKAKEAFFLPFVPILLGCLATFLLNIEGVICIAMYLPAGLVLAGVGGLAARSHMNLPKGTMLGLIALPFATHFAENKIQFSTQSHAVKNSIVIQGTAPKVWGEIKSVKTITASELKNSWVHQIGFPRPLDAEIDFERVGGVRTARFERGLVFVETVDQWKPNELLSFKIDIDPKNIPPTALDEHVTIGGPFFDVLRGTYQIVQNPDGSVTLNLESQFRLSTHFNFYAGFWTDLIMHQIQSDILSVIKKRVEKPET